jgi:Protein of unknown function (DUF3147)
MRVAVAFSGLKKIKWSEYAVRFVFGGTITAVTGVLAALGPKFGGLFLTFPAIFPASATLVEKHERRKRIGVPKTMRGRQAAALDARGAAMASIGLIGFAIVVWKLAPIWNGALTLFAASAVWLAISLLIWHLRRFRPKSC